MHGLSARKARAMKPRLMKPRHAAALALVGWYLMLPPTHLSNGHLVGDTKTPFSDWTTLGSFDTAHECAKYQMKLIHSAKGQVYVRPFTYELPIDPVYSQCVASDDPRLKEK
jgi:hypothetical protein